MVCGTRFCVDLHDLAAHGKIEHHGSLVHDDAHPGAQYAPILVNYSRLRKLLGYAAPGHGLQLGDFLKARAERDRALATQLDKLHAEIAVGELSLTWLLMKNERDEVPLGTLDQFYGEERIPEGWTRPTDSIGLRMTRSYATQIQGRQAFMGSSDLGRGAYI